jgi:hypothetical protein
MHSYESFSAFTQHTIIKLIHVTMLKFERINLKLTRCIRFLYYVESRILFVVIYIPPSDYY